MPLNPFDQFIHSTTATILSVAALTSAIAMFFRNMKELISELKIIINAIKDFILRNPQETAMNLKRKSKMLKILILIMIPTVVFTVRAIQNLPPNVVMMNDIFAAFNKAMENSKEEDYLESIRKSEALILRFGPMADLQERQLIEKKTAIQNGGIKNDEEKKIIWSFGVLHEVSAAWWVKGRSLEALGKIGEALEAFAQSAKYPHALVYDPTWDGFWSPAEDSKARIEYLNKK